MAKSAAGIKYLHVAVYRGGAEIGAYARPLSKRRGVSAGRGRFCEIRSVIWPLWDQLDIILKTKDGMILNPQIPWDGVIHNSSSTHVLGNTKEKNKVFTINASTSASLRFEDLSVAIRIGPKSNSAETAVKPRSDYMASPLTLIADSAQEWTSIGIALAASAVICSFAVFALANAPKDHYEGILDVPPERLLPFLSSRQLRESPNVMQSGMDRLNLIRSVWTFYSDLAVVVGFGERPVKVGPLFTSTIEHYEKLASDQSNLLDAAAARQQLQVKGKARSGSILSIPMVTGEGLDGRVRRVFDKIDVLVASADELADRRVVVAKEFLDGIGLNFDARKTVAGTNENFRKISESFQGIESNDKAQFIQARTAGARAALVQMDIFGKERLEFGLYNCCFSVVGAPLGQEGIVWLAPDFTEPRNGELSFLKASIWGAPVREVPKIIEPIAGVINHSDVEKTVAAGRYQLRLCYEIALRRNQAAKGSMEWRMLIDSRGMISKMDLITSSIKDEELVRCVRDRIAAWKFPRPRGGSVEVRYPFEFMKDKG
jgi:hypothetical protein